MQYIRLPFQLQSTPFIQTCKSKVQKLLTLDVDELFRNAELSFIQTVIVGDIALCFGHWDDHTLLLLPEYLLSRDCPLEMVLLGGRNQRKGMEKDDE